MGIARHQMKKIIFLVSLLLHQMWSQKCDNKFPGHRKAPAINHSNPDNKPTITTCRKDRNDKYNLCQCYDKAGNEVMEDKKEEATQFCCQCPENLDEAYSEFEVIDVAPTKKFSFQTAVDIEFKRCPLVAITSMQRVENIKVENSRELQLKSNLDLPNLKTLDIIGQKMPTRWDQEIGTSVTMASGVFGSGNAVVFMRNTKIAKFPKKLKEKSLEIDSSLFPDSADKIFSSSITLATLTVTNSEILSIFNLGLSTYQSPLTFSNNKIISYCQSAQDNEACFLSPQDALSYSNNRVVCRCPDKEDPSCTNKGQAITKFTCPDIIMKNTFCSDVNGIKDEDDISLEFLKRENVGVNCSKFVWDLEVLKLNLKEEDPFNPPSQYKVPIWLPIGLGVFSLIVILTTVLLIMRMKNQRLERRRTLYKPVKEDFLDEGEPVEDDDLID